MPISTAAVCNIPTSQVHGVADEEWAIAASSVPATAVLSPKKPMFTTVNSSAKTNAPACP